jgi:hypothetical protein
MHLLSSLVLVGASINLASAHVSAWARGMYCMGGPDPNKDDQNTNTIVRPLYDLPQNEWWFQHDRGCDEAPPPEGEFLELPAGGTFEVEFATNRAWTTFSYGGRKTSDMATGEDTPKDDNKECLGPLHATNINDAAGSAFAISYNSEIKDVTLENLVVFSVLYNSPFYRKGEFKVPEKMPACPPGGCMCAWLWVPKKCGQKNMYMAPFKCKVTNPASGYKLDLPAKKPTFCEGENESKCVRGARQMIVFQQKEGNNVEGASTQNIPQYNEVCGFSDGAQDDIFVKDDEEVKSLQIHDNSSHCSVRKTTANKA